MRSDGVVADSATTPVSSGVFMFCPPTTAPVNAAKNPPRCNPHWGRPNRRPNSFLASIGPMGDGLS